MPVTMPANAGKTSYPASYSMRSLQYADESFYEPLKPPFCSVLPLYCFFKDHGAPGFPEWCTFPGCPFDPQRIPAALHGDKTKRALRIESQVPEEYDDLKIKASLFTQS